MANVFWGLTEDGYEVSVIDGCKLLDHYTAGNHVYDSQVVATTEADRVPKRTLRKYARQTALELAKGHGVSRTHVYEDDND